MYVNKNMGKIFEDIKFYFISGGAFAFSFAAINDLFKFILLLVSIIYTGYKLFRMVKEDIEKQTEQLEELTDVIEEVKEIVKDEEDANR